MIRTIAGVVVGLTLVSLAFWAFRSNYVPTHIKSSNYSLPIDSYQSNSIRNEYNNSKNRKRGCLGMTVPVTYSVYVNFGAAYPPSEVGSESSVAEVFCSISPTSILWGDVSWDQIDFVWITESAFRTDIQYFKSLDYPVETVRSGKYIITTVQYPVSKGGPDKQGMGGKNIYYEAPHGRYLFVRKWSVGNHEYEAEIDAILNSITLD